MKSRLFVAPLLQYNTAPCILQSTNIGAQYLRQELIGKRRKTSLQYSDSQQQDFASGINKRKKIEREI